MCADAPDTSGLNQSAVMSTELAQRQLDMQEELIPYYKERQAQLDALTEQVTNAQLGIQRQTADQGADYYDYSKQTFRPVESSLVAEVMQDSTPEAYARLASQAAARTGMSFRNSTAAAERNAASMGVDPSSGQARGINRAATMAAAATGSAAFNSAYDQAKQTAYARKLDVTGIGRNLAGASAAAYGAATGAGSAASGAANNASATAAGTIGTPVQYGAGATGAINAAVGAQSAIVNAQLETNKTNASTTGALIGGGMAMMCDRRLKDHIVALEDVGALVDAMQPVEFEYRFAPGTKVDGFIAQDLHEVVPSAVLRGDSEAGEPEQPWAVDMAALVPLLVRELQSVRGRLRALEAAAQ